jgi:hypothetical protein
VPDHLALIYNPFSRKNLKNGPDYLQSIQALPNVLFYAPDTHAALQGVVEDLRTRSLSCIVVDGGDGTVGKVLSVLHASGWPPEEWPPVAVIPSGNTNLIAADVGYGKRGAEALRCLQTELRSGLAMRKVKQPSAGCAAHGVRGGCGSRFFWGYGGFWQGHKHCPPACGAQTLCARHGGYSDFCHDSYAAFAPSPAGWLAGRGSSPADIRWQSQ